MSTQMIDVTLPGPGPFGFRLAGGKDFNTPVHISKTTPNGKAGWAGLQLRDVVVSINGHITTGLTHFDAQDLVMQCRGDLELKIRRACWVPRAPRGGQWVQAPTNTNAPVDFPSAPPPVRRLEPEPAPCPSGGPAVVHKQFNSPVGLYSATNIADAFKGQVEGMGINAEAVSLPATPMSPVGMGSTPFGAPPGSYEVLHSKPRPMAQSYSQQAPRAQNYAPPMRGPRPQQPYRPGPPQRPQPRPQQHRPQQQHRPVPPQPQRGFSNPGAQSRSFKMLEDMTYEEQRAAEQQQKQQQQSHDNYQTYDDPTHISRGNQSRSFKMLQELAAEEEAMLQDDL